MNSKNNKLKSIIQFQFIIIFLFISNCLTAQLTFVIDTIYFPSRSFSKISTINKSDIWILGGTNNRNVYRLFEKQITDVSSTFQSVSIKPFTDIRTIGTNNVIIGTSGDYLYQFNNGNFTHIDITNGIMSPDIEVITAELNLGTNIQTDQAIYVTKDFKSFTEYRRRENNESLISRNQCTLFKFYDNGALRLGMDNANAQYSAIVPPNIMYSTFISAMPEYYNSGALIGHYFGSSNGLYFRNFSYSAQSYAYLPNHKINVIINYFNDYNLIGTDKGLYITKYNQEPVKINLDGTNREIYDIVLHNKCIYACTNLGLLKISNSDCSVFTSDFILDKNTINLANNSPVNFIQTCSNCPKTTYWDFGDSTYSSLDNPTHIYSQQGKMTVTLRSTNKTCSAVAQKEVIVFNDSLAYSNRLSLNTAFTSLLNKKLRDCNNIIVTDLNNDDLPDVISNCFPRSILINKGKEFEVVQSPFNGASMVGDFNNDGNKDVLVGSNNDIVSYLYLNNGDLTFKKDTVDIAYLMDKSITADCDNDGYLDVLALRNARTTLYKNNKGTNFSKVENNDFSSISNQLYATWVDTDNDNDLDLYVVEMDRNQLFINDGTGHFTEMGISDMSFSNDYDGTSASWGDFNNDGKLDLIQSSSRGNYFFINQGNNIFSKVLTGAIVNDNSIKSVSSSAGCDLNNDGNLDYIYLNSFSNSRNFINNGNLVFYNDSSSIYEKNPIASAQAVACEDFDVDGDIDLAIIAGSNTSNDVPVNAFYENKGYNRNWLRVMCYGTKSNYNAIGARVRIKTKTSVGDIWQTKSINLHPGNNVHGSDWLHFGLGNALEIDTLLVYWPSGDTSCITKISTNKTIKVIEPSIRIIGETAACENELPRLTMPDIENVSYKWYYNDYLIDSVASNILIAQKQGLYKVEMQSPDFGKITAKSVNITFKPVTKAHIKYETRTSFCTGDSIRLSADYYENMKYTWVKQSSATPLDTSIAIYVKDNSGFKCVFTNEFECRDTSELLIPTVYPLPIINLNNDTSVCYNDSILLSTGFNEYKYNWSTHDTIPEIYIKAKGSYYVTVTDLNNCVNKDSIYVKLLPSPDVFLGNNTTVFYFDTLFIHLKPGYVTYQWQDSLFASERLISGTIDGFGNHLYSVTVTDQYGCKNTDSILITIEFKETKHGEQKPKVYIFPNPAYSEISLYYDFKTVTGTTKIEFINSVGLIVYTVEYNLKGENITPVRLNNIKKGVYYLRISNNQIKEILKLSVL